MVCKGTCERYLAKRPLGGQRYANGQKMCITCQRWITWDGVCCPCCSYRLRSKPRRRGDKLKYNKVIECRI